MKRRQKIVVIMFLLMAFVFCIGGELLAAEKFSGVTAGDQNGPYINFVASKGIISGFPDGTYHPRDGLTRAQAAVIICKAAALKTPAIENTDFKDVPAGYWAVSYIDAASKAGYLKGFSDGTYKPDNKFTRAQAVSLIMRICTQKERAALPALQDMNSQHWAAPEMATALSLDMIQLSSDGKQIYPDAAMTRSDLARALAILLTKDPVLSQVKLTGKLTEIKGDVTLIRNNKTQKLTKDIDIFETDVIKTGSDGRARLMFPDGSGNLLEGNCEIVIKKADGKSYIKQNGTPGVAVDFLNIELKKGTLFAALSTKTENKTDTAKTSLSSRLASRDPLRQLAAAAQPWYKTAQEKKVRMKVDMPWGVAAVRGTFIKVSVNPNGTCEVCCLSGTADTSSSAGNVAVNGGDKAVIPSENSAPQTGDMSAADKADMENEEAWIVNTALQMDASRAVEVLVEVNAETSVQTVIDALKDAGIDLKPEVIEQLKQDLEDLDEKTPDIALDPGPKDGDKTPGVDPGGSDGGISYVAYDKAGTYGGASAAAPVTISGTAIINAAGVTLQNMIINGNLTLAASIGEGEVTLQNVKVQGTTTINGGGACSVHVIDCQLYTVIVDKENNSVRIVAKGTTTIGPLTLNSGAILQEDSGLTGTGFSEVLTGLVDSGAQITFSGNFTSISISSPNINIAVESGCIGQINLASSAIGTSLNLADGVSISSLAVNATGVTVGGSGAISSWTVAPNITAVIGGNPVSGSGSSGISYGEITSLLDDATLTQLTCIEGTANGHGKTILGGGVFIKNNTLNKWVMPRFSRADSAINGKTYVDTRSDDCLIPFADAADYSNWATDDLSGLNLPNGHDYTLYLRVNIDGIGPQEDQDIVAINYETLSGISTDISVWSVSGSDCGYADLNIFILNQDEAPITGLGPDQFTIDVEDEEGTTTTLSFTQLPFGSFDYLDGAYYVTYFGSGEYVFSNLIVGGIPITAPENANSMSAVVYGGAAITGLVTDGDNQPLPGVKVEASNLWAPWEVINYTFTSLNTDDNGNNYSLGVPNGCDIRVKFEKPSYSCDYLDLADNQCLFSEEERTLENTIMHLDSELPNGILIDKPYVISGSCTLTATGGPLSDESWKAIYELINTHFNSTEDNWISLSTDYESYLYLDQISVTGETMTLVLGYYCDGFVEGQADILQDFIIPQELVVDRAGNQAANDIVIKTRQLGPASSGEISIAMPYVAYCDQEDRAHIVEYDDKKCSWSEIGQPTTWTNSQTIKLLDTGSNIYAVLLNEEGVLSVMEKVYAGWPALGTPIGSISLFDAIYGEEDSVILACQETLFNEVYEPIGYKGDLKRCYNGSWQTMPEVFYSGAQRLQDLQMVMGGNICFVTYDSVDSIDKLSLKGFYEGSWNDIVTDLPISPDCGFSTISMADGEVFLAYVDVDNKLTVMDYCYGEGGWISSDVSPVDPVINPGASSVQMLSWNGCPTLLYTSGPLNKATISYYADGTWFTPEGFNPFSVPIATGRDSMAIEGSSDPYLLIKGQDGFLYVTALPPLN